MDNIITILGLSCLTILFVTSEPMVLLKRLLGFKEEEYMDFGKVKAFLFRLITCCLCSGFWIGLIFTWDIYMASIISISSEIIKRKLD